MQLFQAVDETNGGDGAAEVNAGDAWEVFKDRSRRRMQYKRVST